MARVPSDAFLAVSPAAMTITINTHQAQLRRSWIPVHHLRMLRELSPPYLGEDQHVVGGQNAAFAVATAAGFHSPMPRPLTSDCKPTPLTVRHHRRRPGHRWPEGVALVASLSRIGRPRVYHHPLPPRFSTCLLGVNNLSDHRLPPPGSAAATPTACIVSSCSVD